MAKKRILILGAGLAGLSAAWHLKKRNIGCQVFEKENEVGGLCRSKKINGFTFDYDGHALHFRHKKTFNLIKALLGNNLREHQRSAWIYSYGRYTRYPFQANLFGLPPRVIKECLIGVIQNSKNSRFAKGHSFLDWINRTFGRGIARHFMVPYNTKFWTLPPQRLTCAWFDGFIPVPSLNQIIEGTVKESQRRFGYNAHFWYPKKGAINQLPLALAGSIKDIYTGLEVSHIDIIKKRIKFASGAKERFDFLISTIPLPEITNLIKGLPKEIELQFKKLKWNSIFNLNLGTERNNTKKRHWVYFPQKDLCFFRVGFFHNFSSCLVPSNKMSLYAEVSYSKDKPVKPGRISEQIQNDLKKAGIITPQDKILATDINDIKYGYPIYDKNYCTARKAILNFLSRNNIFSCGRYGSWRYLSMEDAFLDGKNTANLILKCLNRIPYN